VVTNIWCWFWSSQQTGEEGWSLLLALSGYMHSGAAYLHEVWAWWASSFTCQFSIQYDMIRTCLGGNKKRLCSANRLPDIQQSEQGCFMTQCLPGWSSFGARLGSHLWFSCFRGHGGVTKDSGESGCDRLQELISDYFN